MPCLRHTVSLCLLKCSSCFIASTYQVTGDTKKWQVYDRRSFWTGWSQSSRVLFGSFKFTHTEHPMAGIFWWLLWKSLPPPPTRSSPSENQESVILKAWVAKSHIHSVFGPTGPVGYSRFWPGHKWWNRGSKQWRGLLRTTQPGSHGRVKIKIHVSLLSWIFCPFQHQITRVTQLGKLYRSTFSN